MVASADTLMRVVEGSTPPAAEVTVELGTETFALPAKVGRVLLKRLADSLMSADRVVRCLGFFERWGLAVVVGHMVMNVVCFGLGVVFAQHL